MFDFVVRYAATHTSRAYHVYKALFL